MRLLTHVEENLERMEIFAALLGVSRERRENADRLGRYQPYDRQKEFHAAGLTPPRAALHGRQPARQDARRRDGGGDARDGPLSAVVEGPALRPADVFAGAPASPRSRRATTCSACSSAAARDGTRHDPAREHRRDDCLAPRPGLVDTIEVRHVSGGVSTIALKSYEKGREKWQGETLDRVWFDEEPPADDLLARG